MYGLFLFFSLIPLLSFLNRAVLSCGLFLSALIFLFSIVRSRFFGYCDVSDLGVTVCFAFVVGVCMSRLFIVDNIPRWVFLVIFLFLPFLPIYFLLFWLCVLVLFLLFLAPMGGRSTCCIVVLWRIDGDCLLRQ